MSGAEAGAQPWLITAWKSFALLRGGGFAEVASHCVKCCRTINLCLAFFSSPRNGSVRGKVSLVLNLYGLRTKAALPRTENWRGDEKGQIHCVKFWLFFQSFANRLPIVCQRPQPIVRRRFSDNRSTTAQQSFNHRSTPLSFPNAPIFPNIFS